MIHLSNSVVDVEYADECAVDVYNAPSVIVVQGDEGSALLALQQHVDAAEPHPSYDVDMVSMEIVFENGLA